MKILLINPGHIMRGGNVGLAYINRYLEGHNTKLIDLGIQSSDIFYEAKKFRPDAIFISVSYFNADKVNELIRKLKLVTGAKIICGGSYLTLEPENIRKITGIDYAIIGEGEIAAQMLLSSLHQENVKIKGVIDNKNISHSRADYIEDLDKLGSPKYEEKHYEYFSKNKYSYILITSRGCPYRCVFCPNPLLIGKKWRARSANSVIDEIKNIYARYRIDSFNIMDDNFSLDKKRAKDILGKINSLPFKINYIIGNGIRADTVDDELAMLLKKSGCVNLGIGVENADSYTYKGVKKNLSLKEVKNAVNILKSHKLNIEIFMIIGLNGTDIKSLRRSLKFVKQLGVLSRWYIAMPIPGTEFYDFVKKEGRFLPLESTEGTWSADPPILFETDNFSKDILIHEFYYLNSETDNYFFLTSGKNYFERFFIGLKNVIIHNPIRIPQYLIWCSKAALLGKDVVFNRI